MCQMVLKLVKELKLTGEEVYLIYVDDDLLCCKFSEEDANQEYDDIKERVKNMRAEDNRFTTIKSEMI